MIVADEDLSAPGLHGEASFRQQARPQLVYNHAVGGKDKWQASGAHTRSGKPCRQPECRQARNSRLGSGTQRKGTEDMATDSCNTLASKP